MSLRRNNKNKTDLNSLNSTLLWKLQHMGNSHIYKQTINTLHHLSKLLQLMLNWSVLKVDQHTVFVSEYPIYT